MPLSQSGALAAEQLRKICLAFPEAAEKEAWERPTYRVRDKIFAMQSGDDERVDVWCKAGPNVQAMLVSADPVRYFAPPYVGPRGWIGIHLDGSVDWDDVEDWITESYRLVAPKRLVEVFDRRM